MDSKSRQNAKHEITESDIQGLKYFRSLLPLLESLHEIAGPLRYSSAFSSDTIPLELRKRAHRSCGFNHTADFLPSQLARLWGASGAGGSEQLSARQIPGKLRPELTQKFGML